MLVVPERLVRGLMRGFAQTPSFLKAFVLGKPATALAIVLIMMALLAVPGILVQTATLPATEASKPPFSFHRQEFVRDNQIYLKAKYEWGDVESFSEETEIWVKAWNDLEMELEYERKTNSPDFIAILEWKVEIEIQSEIFLFIDQDGDGILTRGKDQVVMTKQLAFNDIEWVLDSGGQKNTFSVSDEEGLAEAQITILKGFTEPDGTTDNEPRGSFVFKLKPTTVNGSTHMAIEVKARFLYPDFSSHVNGYLASSCSDGMTQTWSFPGAQGTSSE